MRQAREITLSWQDGAFHGGMAPQTAAKLGIQEPDDAQ